MPTALLKWDPVRRVATWWKQDSNGNVVVYNEHDDRLTNKILDENQQANANLVGRGMIDVKPGGRLETRVPPVLEDQWKREYNAIPKRSRDVPFSTYRLIKASSRDFCKCKVANKTGFERRSGRWHMKV